MSQLSVHLTAGTETLLKRFMKVRHISTKSEAVRIAIQEVACADKHQEKSDFTKWIGLAKKGQVKGKLEKLSDTELWNDKA